MMHTISDHVWFFLLLQSKVIITLLFFSLYLQEIKAWNWSLHDMVWASRSFYYTWNDNLFQDRFSLFARRCFGLCEVFSWMTGTRMSSQRLAHPHPEHFKKSLAIYELCLQNSHGLTLTHKRKCIFFGFCLFAFDKGPMQMVLTKMLTNLWNLSTSWSQC